jgi:hypothetical protein
MIVIYAVVAAGLIAVGIALGIVFITSMAVHDEENAGRWLAPAGPSRRASGARKVTGLGVRRPEATS